MRLEVTCNYCNSKLLRNKAKTERYYCNVECKSEWQKEQKPVSKEWLVQKYVNERLSANDIAKIVDRDPKRVWEWLRGYGIETRPRGSNIEQIAYWANDKPNPFKGKKHSDKTRILIKLLSLKDGRVPYLNKVGVHHMKGKLGSKHPGWRGGTTPERQKSYSTIEWKDAVKKVWKRDDAICQLCKLDHRTVERKEVKFDIHHLYSFSTLVRLRSNPDNLILVCQPCHKWIHSKKNKEKQYLPKRMVLPQWMRSVSN